MKKSKFRTVTAGILIAVLALAAAYLIGLEQGRSEKESVIKGLEKQVSDLQRNMAVTESRNTLSTGRMALCKTVLDLEQVNFGMAETHLNETTAALSHVSPILVAIDPARFEELRREIAAVKIEIGSNTSDMRSRLLDFSSRLDALVKPAQH